MNPTLLRKPGAPPTMLEERRLPLAPEAYAVSRPTPDVWVVRVVATGQEVYRGPGPAVVVRSPAPF
ncbi:hypothetical protein [Hydrogenophaga intermedia]|uniref:Uncharacterized protein n=1 Tax=Hydrogenophaga intermedia TaxID=65786 RepID=A0A1L1PS08_HYDIT|nr:hypothetical protein [Hydrogenophaga intermedia]TMU70125.1 hypothetical protein FGJ01_24345 [Hydrogenophaga intermedia]CDN90529.1 hypothetical protein BN948_04974 [Hydrogenophaga intermedia]